MRLLASVLHSLFGGGAFYGFLSSSPLHCMRHGPSVGAGARERVGLERSAHERGRGLRAALSGAGLEARHELDGVFRKAGVPGTAAGSFPGSVAARIRLSVPPARTDGLVTGHRSPRQPFKPTKTARPNLALEPTRYGRPRPAALGRYGKLCIATPMHSAQLWEVARRKAVVDEAGRAL